MDIMGPVIGDFRVAGNATVPVLEGLAIVIPVTSENPDTNETEPEEPETSETE